MLTVRLFQRITDVFGSLFGLDEAYLLWYDDFAEEVRNQKGILPGARRLVIHYYTNGYSPKEAALDWVTIQQESNVW